MKTDALTQLIDRFVKGGTQALNLQNVPPDEQSLARQITRLGSVLEAGTFDTPEIPPSLLEWTLQRASETARELRKPKRESLWKAVKDLLPSLGNLDWIPALPLTAEAAVARDAEPVRPAPQVPWLYQVDENTMIQVRTGRQPEGFGGLVAGSILSRWPQGKVSFDTAQTFLFRVPDYTGSVGPVDQTGHFEFSGLPGGTYALSILWGERMIFIEEPLEVGTWN